MSAGWQGSREGEWNEYARENNFYDEGIAGD